MVAYLLIHRAGGFTPMARLKATPKTYQQAVEVLGNRQSIKLGNNTWIERDCADCIVIRLHQTDIVNFFADGRITLRTGGWYTVTGSKLTPVFAVNLAQYQQHCADPNCGDRKSVV